MVVSFIHGISCQLSGKSVEEFSSFQNWAVENPDPKPDSPILFHYCKKYARI
jgi:hypothetical protein